MEQWKLDRITAINDEVRELHPLLKQVFSADRSITSYEYTHGNTEMGADFVIARPDPTLGDEHYIGVIVKVGGIKQNYEDVKRQIDECKIERFYDGGKKKIHLTEIWIFTNGSISNGAEKKIHNDYRDKNIRFVDGDKLSVLVDKHASHFWNNVPYVLSEYLNLTHSTLVASESQFSLLPNIPVGDYIPQDLRTLDSADDLKSKRKKSLQRIKLFDAIQQKKIILVQGGMGSGKSSLFRRLAISLCTVENFARYRIIPKVVSFKDTTSVAQTFIKQTLNDLDNTSSDFSEPVTHLLFVDGIDEVNCVDSDRFSLLKEIVDLAQNKENVKIVFGSRAVWTVDEEFELDKLLQRYAICQLTPMQMVQFLTAVCKSVNLTARFTDELTKSNIFKVLPKTPMSTVLLAKIMNAGLKELPQTLPELYSKYTELALGRWDAAKGLNAEKEYPLHASLIQQLAEYMLSNNLDSLGLDEVRDTFKTYLGAREDVPAVDDVIKKLASRTELLSISFEQKVFRFRHKTFLEFFYAVQLKEKMGKAAPINNPFDGYWLGVEYFYLGLVQDAGERIDKLSRLAIDNERQLFLKMLSLGNLLLAAHRTEYAYIERALHQLFLEAGSHFTEVLAGNKDSALSKLPRLQFLATFSYNLRYVLGFDYFKKALDTVSLNIECDASMSEDQRIACSFLVESVRSGLGEKDAFKFLMEKSSADLDWVIRLGIHHIAKDDEIKTGALERFEKRLSKMRKGNAGVNAFIDDLYVTSMIDLRKKIATPKIKMLSLGK